MSETDVTVELSVIQVELIGNGSRVLIDGIGVKGLRDVKIHQSLDGPPVITLEILAGEIIGVDKSR